MPTEEGTLSEPPGLGAPVGKHILRCDALFAAAGAIAFLLGLISPLLVLGFGTSLITVGSGPQLLTDALMEEVISGPGRVPTARVGASAGA